MEKFRSFSRDAAPWYDSNFMCGVCFLFMTLVMGFGFFGINIGWEVKEYQRALWVPGLLIVFSGIVMLSLLVRLVRRYADGKESSL